MLVEQGAVSVAAVLPAYVGADTAQVVYRFTEQQMSEGPNFAFRLAVEQGR